MVDTGYLVRSRLTTYKSIMYLLLFMNYHNTLAGYRLWLGLEREYARQGLQAASYPMKTST